MRAVETLSWIRESESVGRRGMMNSESSSGGVFFLGRGGGGGREGKKEGYQEKRSIKDVDWSGLGSGRKQEKQNNRGDRKRHLVGADDSINHRYDPSRTQDKTEREKRRKKKNCNHGPK